MVTEGATVGVATDGRVVGTGTGLALGTLMLLLGARLLSELTTPLPQPARTNPAAMTANAPLAILASRGVPGLLRSYAFKKNPLSRSCPPGSADRPG